MNDDQFNYAYPEYDKKIVRLYTSDENGTEKLLDVKYSMQNDEIDLSEYNNNLKNYDLKWYYFGSEFNVLRNPVEINDMYTVNEYASQILVAALTPKNEEPGQPNTPETPQIRKHHKVRKHHRHRKNLIQLDKIYRVDRMKIQ